MAVQAVNAVLRNYTVLEEYCKRESSDNRDPVVIYCCKKAERFKVQGYSHCSGRCFGRAGTTLPFFSKTQPDCDGRTLLCKRAKIEKLHSQYSNDEKDVQWRDRVKEVMRTSSADARITDEITLFTRKLWDHLVAHFSEDELKEWSAFDIEALSSDISF